MATMYKNSIEKKASKWLDQILYNEVWGGCFVVLNFHILFGIFETASDVETGSKYIVLSDIVLTLKPRLTSNLQEISCLGLFWGYRHDPQHPTLICVWSEKADVDQGHFSRWVHGYSRQNMPWARKRNIYMLGLGYRLKENCVVQEGSDEFDILISSSE